MILGRKAFISFLLLSASIMAITAFPVPASAVVTCTKGTSRLSTAADIANMTAAGIPNPKPGMEYCPDDINIGKAPGDLKQFLEKRGCSPVMSTGNGGGICPNNTRPLRIDGLDAKFAGCVKDFIEKYEAKYGPNSVCIHDAFRTNNDQKCAASNPANGAAVAKPGNSRHERGIAVDLNPKTGSYTQLRQFAQTYGGGLHFRYACAQAPGTGGDARLNDCPHMESKAADCMSGASLGTRPASQSVPTSSSIPGAGGNPFANPYNPTQQALTNGAMMGAMSAMSPTTAAPVAQQVPTSQPTTIPSIPASNQVTFPTDSGTGNTLGTSVNTSLPAPISSIISVNPTSTKPRPATTTSATSSPTSTTTRSAFDSLLLIANGGTQTTQSTSSTVTATSVPVTLNPNLFDIAVEPGPTSHVTVRPINTVSNATGSIAAGQITVAQTFTSGTQVIPPQVPTSTFSNTSESFITTILTSVRDVLISIRDYFLYRGSVPVPGTPQLWASPPVFEGQ